MRSATFSKPITALAAAAVLLCGCGPDISIPSFSAPHDHLTLIYNGQRTTVAQSGSVSVQISGAPELDYDGPLGCKGRYFTDSDGEFYFHWGPRSAVLLRYDTLYRFAGPPHRGSGQLIWNQDFGGDRITLLANCPPPKS